jgi:hypothetical protein
LQILKFSFLNLVSSNIRFKFAIPKFKNVNRHFWSEGTICGGFLHGSFESENFWLENNVTSRV